MLGHNTLVESVSSFQLIYMIGGEMKNDPKCPDSCEKVEQCSSFGREFRDARSAKKQLSEASRIGWATLSSSTPDCATCSCSYASIMALLKEHEGSSEKMEAIRSKIEERDFRMAVSTTKAMAG